MGLFKTSTVERDENDNILPAPYNSPRPITAAAAQVDLKDKTQVQSLKNRRAEDKWQDEAWEYYDLVGEVGFAARLIASVTSRVRLFPAFIEDEENEPIHVRKAEIDDDAKKAASDALRLLGTGNGGVAGLLRDAAMNLFITGECYLVQQPGSSFSKTPETWQIRSVDEVIYAGGRDAAVAIRGRRSAKTDQMVKLPKNAFVGRIWRMHPRFSDEADSSIRSQLELLDELLLLNKGSRKTIKSRLNAGILYIPDELDNIAQSDGDIDGSEDTYAENSDDNSSTIEEELILAATTPISDEGSASAVVPLVMRGPAEFADKIKHITFEQSFDEHHSARQDKVLNRILAGLDIPKEVVAGISDSKYANAMVIEESLYKAHVEPLILLIVDALTVVFLRPVLRAMGFDEDLIQRVVVWYDPSPITTKPSKSEQATLGYDKKILSASAWRRENGFSESDAPSEQELGGRVAIDRGLLSEPVTEALFRLILPTVMQQVREIATEQSPSGSTLNEVLENNEAPTEQAEPQQEQGPTPPPELIEP